MVYIRESPAICLEMDEQSRGSDVWGTCHGASRNASRGPRKCLMFLAVDNVAGLLWAQLSSILTKWQSLFV